MVLILEPNSCVTLETLCTLSGLHFSIIYLFFQIQSPPFLAGFFALEADLQGLLHQGSLAPEWVLLMKTKVLTESEK